MKSSIEKETMSARTALIACFLTVCFENTYGRKDLRVMNSLAGANLARTLSIQISSAGSSRPVVLEPCTVEDELVAAFSRLDVSAMIVVDLRTASEHRIPKMS